MKRLLFLGLACMAIAGLVFAQADALDFHYTSKTPVMDLYATNSLDVSGLTPGKYQFKAVLKNRLRNKQIVKTVEFSIK